jgi:hypothetical protein
MTKITVKTLNNEYVLEQDDAGNHKIVSSTHPRFGTEWAGLECSAPEVGRPVRVSNGRGGHTSTVKEIIR